MQIEIDDIFDTAKIPIADVARLGDHLLRFRLASPRQPTPYHRLLLEGGTDTRSILPDAPNRAGIQLNFDNMSRLYRESFEKHKASPLAVYAGVSSPEDLLRHNVAHFCQPDALYTNGQVIVTMVSHARGVVSAAPHTTMRDGIAFSSAYEPLTCLDIDRTRVFGDRQAAETWVRSELSTLKVRGVPMRRGEERRTLLLQPAGHRLDQHGATTLTTWIAYFSGREERLRLERTEEPYALFNRLDLDGFRADTCATCLHFRFSGMSRDMSGGSKGYCWLRRERAGASGFAARGMDVEPSFRTIIAVDETCDSHRFVEDADRPIPYGAQAAG